MRVNLYNNGTQAFVSSFVGKFVGGVCVAVAASLKAPVAMSSLLYDIDGEAVRLFVDGLAVPLNMNQGFAETIVRDTLRGMLRHLKGLDPEGAVRIEIEIEGHS